MQPREKAPARTAVYVDGYNLYYGRLRGSAFKWLDLVTLFERVLAARDQNEQLVKVTLFTAHALARFATHGQQSVEAQNSYHRALMALHEDRIRIVNGLHTMDSGGTLLPTFVAGQPYDRTVRTRVWKIEEKQTDVNLALTLYRDACRGLFDRVIVVSNDSDAAPALSALEEDFPVIMRGVVVPIPPPAPGSPQHRRVSGSLAKFADWTMPHLSDELLHASQLPPIVPTKKKPIRKPAHW